MQTRYPENPVVAVGAVVYHREKVLLVRRAKPPATGQWAIPGGSVNLGESLQQAAQRELLEETGVSVRVLEPVCVFDVIDRDDSGKIRYHYVIVDFAAEYVQGEIRPGDDALEVRWVSEEELGLLEVNHRTRQLLAEKFGFGDSPIRNVRTHGSRPDQMESEIS
jgi:ADP-ribose pyrophosphatase